MRPSAHERLLHALTRVYSALLWTYPPRFRREYSHEMTLIFQDEARTVLESGSGWSLARFVLHIGHDWFRTTLREYIAMTSVVSTFRWIAALPLAILAAVGLQRLLWRFLGRLLMVDFRHLWIVTSVGFFFMGAAFVAVGVAVAPSRRDSVARIALGVVGFWALASGVLGALNVAITPVLWGGCLVLGGLVGYAPWRLVLRARAR